MDGNADLMNEAADLIAGMAHAMPTTDNAERFRDLIARLRKAAAPRVLEDYLVHIDYRTRNGNPGSARIRTHAASYDEAYGKARAQVSRRRYVAQIDGGHAIGHPLPIVR